MDASLSHINDYYPSIILINHGNHGSRGSHGNYWDFHSKTHFAQTFLNLPFPVSVDLHIPAASSSNFFLSFLSFLIHLYLNFSLSLSIYIYLSISMRCFFCRVVFGCESHAADFRNQSRAFQDPARQHAVSFWGSRPCTMYRQAK